MIDSGFFGEPKLAIYLGCVDTGELHAICFRAGCLGVISWTCF